MVILKFSITSYAHFHNRWFLQHDPIPRISLSGPCPLPSADHRNRHSVSSCHRDATSRFCQRNTDSISLSVHRIGIGQLKWLPSLMDIGMRVAPHKGWRCCPWSWMRAWLGWGLDSESCCCSILQVWLRQVFGWIQRGAYQFLASLPVKSEQIMHQYSINCFNY